MAVKEIMFKAPAGQLEARYYRNEDPDSPIALVLHPHPLKGGNMDNNVTYRMFRTFMSNGFSVMRFNSRGVGRSQGIFEDGPGELLDATTVLVDS